MSTRVLIVEDNPGDADLAKEWLTSAPIAAISVATVDTLRRASAVLSSSRFDAIVLDLELPDSSGLQTLTRTRQMAQDVPIIVVSTMAQGALRDELLAAGADEVLSKDEANSWLFSRCVLYVVERDRTHKRHRELETLLDTTPDAILVVTDDGIVRYVNQASLDLFGVPRARLMGESIGFSVKDGQTAEIAVHRSDGDRVCEMHVVPLYWDGAPASLASIRDVTEARQAAQLERRAKELEAENRRIHEMNRLKSEFLANMSHELRTPLNAIIGFSQLLHSGKVPIDAPEHREFLGDVLSSGRHLLRLVNDVLDLAKVEAGRLELNPEPIVVSEIVGEVVAILRTVAAQRTISIRTELSPDLEEVELDPVRLTQILYNFLSNALKFGTVGGEVVLRTVRSENGRFRLEVRDNGDGIAPEDVEKLFMEFQQVGVGRSRRHQGTGLGLAFTRRLVEAHGGTVGVDSHLGEGSTFYATLPVRLAAPEKQAQQS